MFFRPFMFVSSIFSYESEMWRLPKYQSNHHHSCISLFMSHFDSCLRWVMQDSFFDWQHSLSLFWVFKHARCWAPCHKYPCAKGGSWRKMWLQSCEGKTFSCRENTSSVSSIKESIKLLLLHCTRHHLKRHITEVIICVPHPPPPALVFFLMKRTVIIIHT